MEIKDFILHQSFCQADLVKGFRFLDSVGRILNDYIDDLPEYRVEDSRLVMRARRPARGRITRLEIGPEKMWIHIERPPTLTYIGDQTAKVFGNLSAILDVQRYSRLGFRINLLWPLGDAVSGAESLAATVLQEDKLRWQTAGSLEELTLQSRFDVGDKLHATVGLSTIQRAAVRATSDVSDANEGLPQHALLLDVDCYETDLEASNRFVGRFFDRAYRFLEHPLMQYVAPVVEAER